MEELLYAIYGQWAKEINMLKTDEIVRYECMKHASKDIFESMSNSDRFKGDYPEEPFSFYRSYLAFSFLIGVLTGWRMSIGSQDESVEEKSVYYQGNYFKLQPLQGAENYASDALYSELGIDSETEWKVINCMRNMITENFLIKDGTAKDNDQTVLAAGEVLYMLGFNVMYNNRRE